MPDHRLPVVADRVDSLHLPACGFPAPGDPRFIASDTLPYGSGVV